jgi:hypothetical protein
MSTFAVGWASLLGINVVDDGMMKFLRDWIRGLLPAGSTHQPPRP